MSLKPEHVSACARALAALPPSPTSALLSELVRLASHGEGSALSAARGFVERAPQPEQRVLLAVGLSMLDPTLCADPALEAHFVAGIQQVALHRVFSEPLVDRWTWSLLAGVDRDPARSRWVHAFFEAYPFSGGLVLSAVRRLVAAGDFCDAEALIEQLSSTEKHDRGLALAELALARGEGVGAAFQAIVGPPSVTTGVGRGQDELFALGAVLRRALNQVGARPDLGPLVARMIRYGAAGQRQQRPTVFAKDLAEAALACAQAAGADRPELLEYSQALLGAIVLDGLAGDAEASIERARARISAGRGAAALEPGWVRSFEPSPPSDGAWRLGDDVARRVKCATQQMAKAHIEGDWLRFFDALAVGLSPAGRSFEALVLAWRDVPQAQADAALLDLFKREPTPDNRWCVKSAHEPWEALAQVQDLAVARALIELMLERDFVSRAYARGGKWEFPRSISWEVAALCVRVGERALIERLVERIVASSYPGAGYRLFAVFRYLGEHQAEAAPIERWRERLGDLRWSLWGLAVFDPRPLGEIRSSLGEPLPELIPWLCRAYARGGRFDEALALSEHPLQSYPRMAHYHPRDLDVYPPTQGALLAIADCGVELTPAQAKLLIRRMKAAPRHPRTGHADRLKQLRRSLAG